MIEDDDDLLLFLSADEFAITASVLMDGMAPFDVVGIYDTRPPFSATNFKGFKADDDFGRGLGAASGAGPRFLCRSADVETVKPGRATFTLTPPREKAPKTFNVFDIQPDGTGMALLTLKRA